MRNDQSDSALDDAPPKISAYPLVDSTGSSRTKPRQANPVDRRGSRRSEAPLDLVANIDGEARLPPQAASMLAKIIRAELGRRADDEQAS
ncbi:MAG: hypothetical protein M3Y89_13865 [Actinomycetota bacterium]|nr:hypothetical protein [Actinomycetota bacterium]